jgi:aminodeoxychorismate synthase component I
MPTGLLRGWADPEAFFLAHAAHRPRAFWLDGSGSRPWSGRMTYVGWLEPADVSLTWHAASQQVRMHTEASSEPVPGGDVFEALQAFDGRVGTGLRSAGWVGFFGYAARPDLPAVLDPEPSALDACWLRALRRVAFDHSRHRVYAVAPPAQLDGWKDELAALLATTPEAPEVPPPGPAEVVDGWDAATYRQAFDEVQRELRWGNSYETNLTYRTTVTSPDSPVDVYRRLRRLSPAPYAAFVSHLGTSVLSSSPERFATIGADGVVETRPIKGTTPRDPDPERDRRAAERLRQEPKFVGENLMIVDLLRNDMSQVCQVGSVQVTDLMHVESYPAVHQLVTTISGRLRPDVSTLQALRALYPGGSMTGAPKLRTMEIIAATEGTPRGIYSGAVGWLLDDGTADLGIVIRTLVHRDGRYTLGTGGGITVHSDADEEYAETTWKAANLLRALGL